MSASTLCFSFRQSSSWKINKYKQVSYYSLTSITDQKPKLIQNEQMTYVFLGSQVFPVCSQLPIYQSVIFLKIWDNFSFDLLSSCLAPFPQYYNPCWKTHTRLQRIRIIQVFPHTFPRFLSSFIANWLFIGVFSHVILVCLGYFPDLFFMVYIFNSGKRPR